MKDFLKDFLEGLLFAFGGGFLVVLWFRFMAWVIAWLFPTLIL